MLKRSVCSPLFCLLLACLPGSTLAAEEKTIEELFALDLAEILEIDVFEMGEIVTSSPSLLQASGQIFEITEEDIRAQNAHNVFEALRFVPGLRLSYSGILSTGVSSIRGSEASDFVMLVDGRPVYEPISGLADLKFLPIDNVSKIKIIKGPVPAAYGANTLGGVINIITKRGTEKNQSRADVSIGEHGTRDYWLETGGQKEKLNYFVTGSFRESDGYELASDFTSTSIEDGGMRDQTDYEKLHMSANLGYDFNQDTRIAFLTGYYDASAEIPKYPGSRRFALRWDDWNRYYFDLTGETRLGENTSIKTKLYYDNFSNTVIFFEDDSYTAVDRYSKFDNSTLGLNVHAMVDLSESFQLLAGTLIKRDETNTRDSRDDPWEKNEVTTSSLFTELTYKRGDNFSLALGLTYSSLTGLDGREDISDYSPMLALIYNPWPETTFHASVGKKSRLPNNKEMLGGGGADLDPVDALMYAAGVERTFQEERFKAGITLYRTEMSDVIDRPGGRGTPYENSDEYDYQGTELQFSAKLSETFSLSADYTYMDSNYVDQPDEALENKPEHQWNVRLQYIAPKGLSVFLQGSYLSEHIENDGEDEIDSFILLNSKLSYEVRKGITPYIAVENILDEDYALRYGQPMPGRTFFVGLNVRF